MISFIFHFKIFTRHLLFILCPMLLLAALLLAGCSSTITPISKTGLYYDTFITITIYDKEKESCLEECMILAQKYENMFSPTIEGSDVWNINHSNGQPVTVSDETIYLIETALFYCELANGQIDLTINTVSELWDFHATATTSPSNHNSLQAVTSRLPDSEAIAEATSHVDYHNLIIEGNTVTLSDPKASISLGFIAKGYIADKMKEYLISQNVDSALINLGGNLLAVGSKPDYTPFQFGIQKPFDEQGTPITTVSVSDKSVVSSGIYERFFYENNVLYHHILNPETGYPVQNELLAVTILSDSSTMGDALSTTCLVLGLENGMKLIESLAGIEAIFVTDDYSLHYTSGIEP